MRGICFELLLEAVCKQLPGKVNHKLLQSINVYNTMIIALGGV